MRRIPLSGCQHLREASRACRGTKRIEEVAPTIRSGRRITDSGCNPASGIIYDAKADADGVRAVAGIPGRVDIDSEECEATPDAPRYKALGNAVTVNVIEWIAKRIREVENE